MKHKRNRNLPHKNRLFHRKNLDLSFESNEQSKLFVQNLFWENLAIKVLQRLKICIEKLIYKAIARNVSTKVRHLQALSPQDLLSYRAYPWENMGKKNFSDIVKSISRSNAFPSNHKEFSQLFWIELLSLIKTKKIKVVSSGTTEIHDIIKNEDQFLFYGFLPKSETELYKTLEPLSQIKYSLIFFLPSKKINFYLKGFKKFFSGRKVLIAREITKIHETFIRDEIDNIKPFKNTMKGELTLVVSEDNNKSKIIDKEKRGKYVKHLYKKLQREGQLERDVDRLIRNDRIAWGSSMIACKDADAMVTGNIRHYAASIEKLKKVVNARPNEEIFGMTMIVSKGKTILVADTNVTELPSAERLVNISKSCVRIARLFGFEPKVAFLSHSTFGKPISRNTRHVRDAIEKLKKEKVDFDFDGEMQPDVALNPIYKEIYPFSKIVGNANILIMPALHSAAISTKLMKVFCKGA